MASNQLGSPIYGTQMPDYSNAFNQKWNNSTNLLLFRTGLLTSTSTDPLISMLGKNMMHSSLNGSPSQNLTLKLNNTSYNGVNWDLGFNVMSQAGNLIGGKVGLFIGEAGQLGSSIRMISQANKGLKNGLTGASKAKAGGIGATVGIASDILSMFMPQKTEYSGDKGDVAQTIDLAYDSISDAAMAFGPVGMMVGGIMKGGALLGKGMNALGGGTDGMTTTDAILGSSFLNLTPLGLVNGFGGKTTDTITKDDDAFSLIGSSYTGTEATVNNAVKKSGKKYGLLSSGARKSANRLIANAQAQQNLISNISDNTLDRFNIKDSMSAINGNRYGLDLLGGYDLSSVRIGRHGMSLLNRARLIIKALKGTKVPYNVWVKDVNPDFLSKYYDLETAYNYLPIELLNKWKMAVNSKNPEYYMNYKDKDGNYPYHLGSVAPILGTEDYIFLKKGRELDNPELHWETDTYYNGSNGLNKTHDIVYEGDRYYYRKKKETPQHKNGGSIITLVKESVIELVNPNDVPEFKNGGSINVIPDGALHARKHNMNLEGITEKGIPVVSEEENGKIELQAEIEKEEIIFRLEVTQKLEELLKKYYNEETSLKEKDELALEAGKLITEELLHNTKDNAGLL